MSRIVLIIVLVVAGEMIFGLPFHTARFFRPTMLDVFGFTNTQLGDLFAAYGVVAMLSYFPGGALADRYPARTLLSLSLATTALGGFYMATIPGAGAMAALYAYWGLTTIFLFWGALIRATREWGGHDAQGVAFGVLEGGRGLVAAGVAMAATFVFASMLPADVTAVTDDVRRTGFRTVILIYSGVALAAAALTWFLVPVREATRPFTPNPFNNMAIVVRRPVVWAQAAVIICAYCGYKGLDNYALYAVDVLGMNEVEAARFATWGAFLRPVAAISAGVIADRFGASRSIGVVFLLLVGVYVSLGVLVPAGGGRQLIVANLLVSFFAVFALRGIYFALLEETRTPAHVTGAAVGMVSLVGYTPEIFFAPIAGRLLDASPGIEGHQHYFLFLTVIAAIGVVVTVWLVWLKRRGVDNLWPEAASLTSVGETNGAAGRSG